MLIQIDVALILRNIFCNQDLKEYMYMYKSVYITCSSWYRHISINLGVPVGKYRCRLKQNKSTLM